MHALHMPDALARITPRVRRACGAGVAATGLVCPCHWLAGAVAVAMAATTGAAPTLSPEAQDGIHALYLPAALLLGAYLLTGHAPRRAH